jgi:UDP-N-acetylmuramoyl-L-alanyl-D-glutamate--2,6-diaminopimelate ligase
MQAYFEAKASLFSAAFLDLQDGQATAVVNVDDPWGQQLAERLGSHAWRCSLQEGSEAELRMEELQFSSEGVRGVLVSPHGRGAFQSPLLGRFNLMNQLQAVGALLQQGLPLANLLQGLASFRGVPGRMERVGVGRAECCEGSLPAVLVDYAHTPDGLESALKACRPFARGQLICVFGCGGDRDRTKRPLMGSIAARLADQVVVTSDNPRTEDPQQILQDVIAGIPEGTAVQVEADRGRAIAAVVAAAQPSDLVLIAGKGHEDYQILGTTKIHFDDREEAEKALRERPC